MQGLMDFVPHFVAHLILRRVTRRPQAPLRFSYLTVPPLRSSGGQSEGQSVELTAISELVNVLLGRCALKQGRNPHFPERGLQSASNLYGRISTVPPICPLSPSAGRGRTIARSCADG